MRCRAEIWASQIKGIYGDRLRLEDKTAPIAQTIPTAVVQNGGHELVFFDKRSEWSDYNRGLEDSDVFDWIVARPISETFYYDGC